jgi:hypothetical protein
MHVRQDSAKLPRFAIAHGNKDNRISTEAVTRYSNNDNLNIHVCV